jgi:hypothetical protein
MKKTLIIVLVLMLLSSVAMAMSPKRKACLRIWGPIFENCLAECRADPSPTLEACNHHCNVMLERLLDKCEQE